MRRSTPLTLLAVLAGVIVALLSPAGPASAHAYLATSAPADGAVLNQAPELLTLGFTERVELRATTVDIVDGDGRRYAPTSMTLRNSDVGGTGTETPVSVVVGLPQLPANVYHVRWRTLSSDDLHATSGNLVIGVQRTVTAAGSAAAGGPAPAESVLRGLGVLGLSVLLGGALLAALTGSAAGLRRRLRVVAACGGVLAAISAPALLYAQVSAAGSASVGLLGSQALSVRWFAYELGLAVLTAAMLARSSLRTVAPVAIGAALSSATGAALLGHAGAGSPLTVAITAIHILAAGGWAGSVVAAAAALVPRPRRTTAWRPDAGRLLRAFGVMATGCVTALAISGLLMVGGPIATVDGLLTTPYGLLLLAKLALSAAAGTLGLRTARRLRDGRPGDGPLLRALVTEGMVLITVLGLAGTLASAAPANGPRFQVVGVTTAPQVSGQVADLVDAVSVRPNIPGRNVVSMSVNDTRRPALAPIAGVSVTLIGPDGSRTVHPVIRGADGSWTLTTDDIRTAGRWRISVTVLRPGMAAVTDEHNWGVAGGTARVTVSEAPLRPVTLALAGVLATVVIGAIWRKRRRVRRSQGWESAAAPVQPPAGTRPDQVPVLASP
jgi:copper transport protein